MTGPGGDRNLEITDNASVEEIKNTEGEKSVVQAIMTSQLYRDKQGGIEGISNL